MSSDPRELLPALSNSRVARILENEPELLWSLQVTTVHRSQYDAEYPKEQMEYLAIICAARGSRSHSLASGDTHPTKRLRPDHS